ncbi:pirin family protein [Marinilongibacter aquaticus]|uniref:pirin family protein n=1 Tax=Marinilongibacter aquaticus TaxID=2975157 RepID=UPI0021BD1586|nr:pirin family protein [Marinilongibacter aquaticus]UBM60395.1 pirin family protein [Marinilongibacter aquaticus]
MKATYHQADSRGFANHGWLKSNHTFSFANYYDPKRTQFGALRVLNDDHVDAGMGFGRHPHRDMEIVSIPLSGELAHADSMGNKTVIREGEVQIMSAGTGIQHSEMNNSSSDAVKFLQIWVFPEKQNLTPRYDQQKFDKAQRLNQFQTVVSPVSSSDEGVKIHQNAWFSLVDLEEAKKLTYTLHDPTNGVYLFVLKGELKAAGNDLKTRDGLGLTETSEVELEAQTAVELLLMEVPMH